MTSSARTTRRAADSAGGKRSARSRRNSLSVDIGGTFTDIVLMCGPEQYTLKVLTTPRAPEEGVMQGVLEILGNARRSPEDLDLFILGTTLATNALIERKGARTALVTTEGFRDLIEIGQENRFALYDLFITKPEPLVPRHLRYGIPERINVAGDVLAPLDEAAVVRLADELEANKVESVAIALLHSYRNPAHERRVRDILSSRLPDLWITLSSDVCPEIREYERISTACANAYVQPVVAGYLRRLQERMAVAGMHCPFFLMTSGGAITTAELGAREPVRLVESGPAGGAILAREVARQCGITKALSFDMGGTTAKICFIDDYEPQHSRSFEFGRMYRFLKGSGLPIRIPVIEMVEIGAGGGSIASVDELQRVSVGPDSAGSEPGPASYGRGGTRATVTDANAVLGLLDPDRFAAGKVRLDLDRAQAAVAADVAGPLGTEVAAGALAISEIVTENMANAARVYAMELGKITEEYVLIAFGGAAPLHATQLAAKLGIPKVIIPDCASVGSALGFLWAPVAYQAIRSHYQKLDTLDLAGINRLLAEMQRDADGVVRKAAPGEPRRTERLAYMRYIGQGYEIPVVMPAARLTGKRAIQELRARFEARYRTLYGRIVPNLAIEIMSWAVTVSTAPGATRRASAVRGRLARPVRKVKVLEAGASGFRSVPVYERDGLKPGDRLRGPALIQEQQTTTMVNDGFTAEINSLGHIALARGKGAA